MSESPEAQLAKTIGKLIARWRQKCDLTQEAVAERLGIGYEAVSRFERGVVIPTIPRLMQLADIFQCQLSDLVTEASHRTEDQIAHLSRLLAPLNSTDRALVVDMVETLSARLASS